MSKIGRRPVNIPAGVTVASPNRTLTVTGPKGRLSWPMPPEVEVKVTGDAATVTRLKDTPRARAQHGLTRALLANMVRGVTEGYAKQLKVMGVGYRVEALGNGLRLSLGYSHPIDVPAPAGISLTIDKNIITVSGIDKQLVGETAARIRALKKPEPYKGKGVAYVDEVVRRKPGKAAKAVGVATQGGA
jgi:large subunit ribosomal protein L6